LTVSRQPLPESGVHPASAAPHALRRAAERQGLSWREIDLSAVHDKRSLMTAFAQGLRLPVGFGGNWDALADVLHDQVTPNGVCLCLTGVLDCADRIPDDFRMLRSVLSDVAAEWQSRGRRCLVLLAGVSPGGIASSS
jgi:RNAse (barnase) inhibitor barstar